MSLNMNRAMGKSNLLASYIYYLTYSLSFGNFVVPLPPYLDTEY